MKVAIVESQVTLGSTSKDLEHHLVLRVDIDAVQRSVMPIQGHIVECVCMLDLIDICKQLEECWGVPILPKSKHELIHIARKETDFLLTRREVECLSISLLGFSARQVGRLLYISCRTVESHLQKALATLYCKTKLDCLDMMMEQNRLHVWQELGRILLNESTRTCSR